MYLIGEKMTRNGREIAICHLQVLISTFVILSILPQNRRIKCHESSKEVLIPRKSKNKLKTKQMESTVYKIFNNLNCYGHIRVALIWYILDSWSQG